MAGLHRFRKAAKELNKVKQDQETEIFGELGLSIGGERLVEVTGRPGYVYVRLRSDQNEVVHAYNDKVSPVYDLPVTVIRGKKDKSTYYIKGRDTGRYNNWGSSAYLPLHHTMHEFNPALPGADITWIYGKQYMPLLTSPSGVYGSMNVIINEHPLNMGSGWIFVGTTGTASFDAYKPTGAYARMVLVSIGSNGNPVLTPGGFFDATATGSSVIYANTPGTPTSSLVGISAVRLVSGTSVITWDNIYDLRQFVGVSTGSGGIGGGHVIYNHNTALPQRTNLVFAYGANYSFIAFDDAAGDRTIISGTNTGHRIFDDLVAFENRRNLSFAGPAFTVFDDTGGFPRTIVSGGFPGHRIMDDAVGLTQRPNLNFVGNGFVTWDDSTNGRTVISGTAGGAGSVTLPAHRLALTNAGTSVTSHPWVRFYADVVTNTMPNLILGAGTGTNLEQGPEDDYQYANLAVIGRDGYTMGGISVYHYSPMGTIGPRIDFLRSRGVETGTLAVLKDYELGNLNYGGVNDPNFFYWGALSIRGLAEENWNANSAGAYFQFHVTETGTFNSSSMLDIHYNRIDITGSFYAHSDFVSIDGDLRLGSGSAVYLGSPTQDGTWRFRRDANNLVFERRESSSWVTKQTISA